MKLTEMLKERYNNLHNKNDCNMEIQRTDFFALEFSGNHYVNRILYLYKKLIIRKRNRLRHRL